MGVPVRELSAIAGVSSSTAAPAIAAMADPSPRVHVSSGTHLPALDGVRGIAIALVLLFHIAYNRVTAAGWVGVDLFFVLSGFLITGNLWDGRKGPRRARAFYIGRALRILPLYYGVLFVLLVAIPIVHPLHADEYRQLPSEQWWYWTYLQNWLVALKHPIGGGSLSWLWSLAIEEQFYIFWPLIIWHASQRTITRVCVVVIVAGLLLRSLLMFVCPEAYQTNLFVYVLTPCRLDGLVVGSLIALKIREPGGYAALYRRIRLPALASAACVGAIAVVDLLKGMPALTLGPILQTVGYPALAIAFGGLLVASLGPWRQLMSARVLRWLGVYSYGLYVLHPFVIRALLPRRSFVFGTWQFAIAATIASLVIAWLSYHLYERHWLALKNRLLD